MNKEFLRSNRILRKLIVNKTIDKSKRTLYMWLSNEFELSAPQFMTILETIQQGGSEGMREMYQYLKHENIQSGLDEHGFPVKIEIPFGYSITAKVQFSNFKYLNNKHSSYEYVLPDG